jgi:hypothetical protein
MPFHVVLVLTSRHSVMPNLHCALAGLLVPGSTRLRQQLLQSRGLPRAAVQALQELQVPVAGGAAYKRTSRAPSCPRLHAHPPTTQGASAAYEGGRRRLGSLL